MNLIFQKIKDNLLYILVAFVVLLLIGTYFLTSDDGVQVSEIKTWEERVSLEKEEFETVYNSFQTTEDKERYLVVLTERSGSSSDSLMAKKDKVILINKVSDNSFVKQEDEGLSEEEKLKILENLLNR